MNKASIMLLLVSIVFCAVGVPEAVAQGENYVVRVAEDGERYNYTVRIVDSQLITVTNAAKLILEGLPDAVTLTEVTYLDGATGPLQTQIDGKQAYGTRIVLVDCNLAADVTGKAYNTVAEAIAYAVTQTPSAASPWLVVFRPGIYVESITCAEYVDLLGEGTVEIQTATDSTAAITLCSNVTLTNITARATSGENVKAFQVSAALTDVVLRNCRGIVDPLCTGNTDGLYSSSFGLTLSGEMYGCYFEAPYDAVNISEVGTLRMRDCRFYGYQTGTSGTANAAVTSTDTTLVDTRATMTVNQYIGYTVTCDSKTMTVVSNTATTFTGASWSGGGNPGDGDSWTVGKGIRAAGAVIAKGTIYADNCEFVADVGATSTGNAYGIYFNGNATLIQGQGCRISATTAGAGLAYAVGGYGKGSFILDSCPMTVSSAGTGTANGVYLTTTGTTLALAVTIRDCNISLTSTASANCTGVRTNEGGAGTTIAMNVIGGSISYSGAGTNLDAVNTAGTLSLENVASGGSYYGTITYAGDVRASTFDGIDVSALDAIAARYGNRVVIADLNHTDPDVAGRVYDTVQEAINYAATQSPAAANPWLVQIMPGDYVEAVTCSAYVDVEGIGDVEIQTSGTNAKAVTLADSMICRNITARVTSGAGTGGGFIAAFTTAGSITADLIDCQGIVDSACTAATDGFRPGTGFSGNIVGCHFESNCDAMNLISSGVVRIRDSGFYATQSSGNQAISGLILQTSGSAYIDNCTFEAAGTGTFTSSAVAAQLGTDGYAQFQGCRFLASKTDIGATTGLGLYVNEAGSVSDEAHLDNCTINVSSSSTGTVRGIELYGYSSTFAVTVTNTAIDAVSTGSGAANAVWINHADTGSTALTIVGGSLSYSTAGTGYDAVCTAGTLTLRDVSRTGVLSGTITETTSIAADAVTDLHVDWGTGTNQVSAADLPIADAGSRLTGTDVEAALQELSLSYAGIYPIGNITADVAAMLAKKVYLMPVVLEHSTYIAKLGWINGTPTEGAVVKMVVYANMAGNTPEGGALLAETASGAVGATEERAYSAAVITPVRVPPGIVWVGIVTDSANGELHQMNTYYYVAGSPCRGAYFTLTNYTDPFPSTCGAVTAVSTGLAVFIGQE